MGEIYLFTGPGGGKTTNALGLALRSMGHGHKVIIIQFMKWWKQTGEYKIQKKLGELYEIYQFGRKGWIGLDNLTDEDRELAKKAIEFTEKIVEKKRPKLLVLDELNLAAYCKLVSIIDIVRFLNKMKRYDMTIVITGRNASKELEDAADYVNVIDARKIPKKIKSTKGIQW